MKGSLSLGTYASIPVFLHWSFILLPIWSLYSGYSHGMNPTSALWLLAFICLLFFCVLLHEFGHALTARRYGVKTHDIILSPIGGLARLSKIPEKPKEELWIALAGPAVNLVIAIVLGCFLGFFSKHGFEFQGNENDIFNTISVNFVRLLFVTNIALALFNMIPAFPMDGGRVFRALISMKKGRLVATKWASRVGQLLSICFIVFGIYQSDLIIGLIGIFIFFAARQEYNSVKNEEILKTTSISEVLGLPTIDRSTRSEEVLESTKSEAHSEQSDDDVRLTSYDFYLSPEDNLSTAYEYMMRTHTFDVPVGLQGIFLGSIDRKMIKDIITKKSSNSWI